MKYMEYEGSPFSLIIDWLAFTLPEGSSEEAIEIIGGDWIEGQTGFRGYPRCWIHASGSGGVGKLGTGAVRSPAEVHVDLSGGIVSRWEHTKLKSVFEWIFCHKGHLTRIDCALDGRKALVPVANVKGAVELGQAVTRATRFEVRSSSSLGTHECTGETLYFGSPASETRLRVYDKRLEMLHKGRADWDEYGVRWELEFRGERAHACGVALQDIQAHDWLEFVVTILRSYLDFRQTTEDAETWKRCQAPLLPWWEVLTEGFRKGRLTVDKRERTLEDMKQYVSWSWAPTLAALRAAPGAGRAWLDQTIEGGERRWKEKHRRLMRDVQADRTYTLRKA